jgi:hypothetical protein
MGISIPCFGSLFGRVRRRLELVRAADHIKTIGKNASRVFPVYVALERTL